MDMSFTVVYASILRPNAHKTVRFFLFALLFQLLLVQKLRTPFARQLFEAVREVALVTAGTAPVFIGVWRDGAFLPRIPPQIAHFLLFLLGASIGTSELTITQREWK